MQHAPVERLHLSNQLHGSIGHYWIVHLACLHRRAALAGDTHKVISIHRLLEVRRLHVAILSHMAAGIVYVCRKYVHKTTVQTVGTKTLAQIEQIEQHDSHKRDKDDHHIDLNAALLQRPHLLTVGLDALVLSKELVQPHTLVIAAPICIPVAHGKCSHGNLIMNEHGVSRIHWHRHAAQEIRSHAERMGVTSLDVGGIERVVHLLEGVSIRLSHRREARQGNHQPQQR